MGLLDRMEIEFENANARVGEATWNSYSGEGQADLDGAYRDVAAVLLNPEYRREVERLAAGMDRGADPVTSRRLDIWLKCFIGAAVENKPEISLLRNSLQQRIAFHRNDLGGVPVSRSELQKILRNEPDRDLRRRAWAAPAALARANRDDLRRLIDLRNSAARALGYRDYVDLVFRLHDIDESDLHGLLNRVVGAARPRYASLIRSLAAAMDVERLAPWDVAFALRQNFRLPDHYFPAEKALERLRGTAAALGFDVDALPIRTVVRDIPFGGYNVAVRIPGDTRFLVNPSEGQTFYTTTFHEFGHSLQAVFTRTTWPILKEYEWVPGAHTAAFSEGMADVIGGFTRRRDWLRSAAAVSEAELDHYEQEILPAQSQIRLFELLANMRIELAAYSDPAADLDAREREMTAEVRMLDYPDDGESLWEANTWYTSYPVYWHNYILASLLADQVHDSMEKRFGPELSSSHEVSDYLCQRFYAPGNSVPWTERLARATGSPLRPEPFLRRLRV
jgi:peptidyl-dipeptidase A